MMAWLSEFLGGGAAAVEPARLRDAPALAQIHGASFHRGWGDGEFETLLSIAKARRLLGYAPKYSWRTMPGGGT